MIRPRKGKHVQVMAPHGSAIRTPVEVVITDVTREWVMVDITRATWRWPAGTGLLLRREALLESNGQLIAPDAAVAATYPPERRSRQR